MKKGVLFTMWSQGLKVIREKGKQLSYSFFFFLKVVFFDRLFTELVNLCVPMDRESSNVLIIIGGGMGDAVVASSVLKHYREYFHDRKLYLLSNVQNHALDILENQFSDETIEVSFYKFKKDPIYAWRMIKKLRRIGFGTVVYNITLGLPRLSPLFYALDAREIYAYEGEPFHTGESKSNNFYVWFDNNIIFPLVRKYFGKIVPSVTANTRNSFLISVIRHEYALLCAVTKQSFNDMQTFVPVANEAKILPEIAKVSQGNFFLVAPGAGVSYRRWPIERFAFVCNKIVEENSELIPVIVGGKDEIELGRELSKLVSPSIDLSGKTDINALKFVIARSKFLFCNDTGFVHLAIAMKKPTICLSYWWEGKYTEYGHLDINRWVYNKEPMIHYDQNWKYGVGTTMFNRVKSISTEKVVTEIKSLINYLKKNGENAPIEPFSF